MNIKTINGIKILHLDKTLREFHSNLTHIPYFGENKIYIIDMFL